MKIKNRAVILTLLLSATASASSITNVKFPSAQLGREWTYNVYLPNGYQPGRRNYPVLYLLHGNGGNENNWAVSGNIKQTADHLIARGEIPPTIIVMPSAGTTWYVDRKEKMESAFIKDLIPHVDNTYSTIKAREGRMIAGLSMGGYGTVRFVMKYPELFRSAAALSPAIYDPEVPENSSARRVGIFGENEFDPAVWTALNYPQFFESFLAKKLQVPMYINTGDDDIFLIHRDATNLYERLRAVGQPAELRILNGGHTWDVWASTIGEAMKYMSRFVSRPTQK